MQEDTLHPERIGNLAGMLAAGAAEAVECVVRDVVTTLHRNFLDRIGHVLHGDAQESLGNILG